MSGGKAPPIQLQALLGAQLGVRKSRLVTLYVAAIEPVLLYGFSLWCYAALTRRNRSLLRSVQPLLAHGSECGLQNYRIFDKLTDPHSSR